MNVLLAVNKMQHIQIYWIAKIAYERDTAIKFAVIEILACIFEYTS